MTKYRIKIEGVFDVYPDDLLAGEITKDKVANTVAQRSWNIYRMDVEDLDEKRKRLKE